MPDIKNRYSIFAAGFWLCAAIHTMWIAPQLLRLPADYAEETSFAATASLRETPSAPFVTSNLMARRVDQTLISSATHSIIQGNVHWMDNAGVVQFENTGIYGVDRRTRMNMLGYGDLPRTGAYLFPLHIERKNFAYWDPMFIGGRQAIFDRNETLDGLQVYVFRFSVTNLDETVGYSHLPDVPERYHAHTDANGQIWIEPTSGTMVDYEEQGTSYFINTKTGERFTDFFRWKDRYTPQIREFKIKQAKVARLRILALEYWVPAALIISGLFSLVAGLRKSGLVARGAKS